MSTVEWIDPVLEVLEPEPFGSSHPIRDVTNEIAAGTGWSPERRERISAAFDELSDGWHADHTSELRLAPLVDALDRADLGSGTLVELGAGTGAGTEQLARRHAVAAAVELSSGMIAEADPALAPLVRADASQLPIRSGSVDIAVLVNMFLFATEIDRVLSPTGRLLWVNTMGDETPIHLPAERVVEVLPGEWKATASRAGTGFWCVARRA